MEPPSSRSVVQVQPMPVPTTQRATLVASATPMPEGAGGSRGLLPALEHLQRISHQRSPSSGSASALPPLSSRGGPLLVGESGVTPGPSAPPHQHLYQRLTGLPHISSTAPVTSRPPVQPSTSVSVSAISSISHNQQQQTPSLPTYRQANSYPIGDGGDASYRPPSSPLSRIMSSSPAMDPSLPDLLHSHMVPPQVPPARPNQHRHQRRSASSRGTGADNGGGNNGQRRHHRRSQQGGQHSGISRQRRRSRTVSGGSNTTATANESGMCKEPCVRCVVKVTSFRWVLVLLSILGVFCVVTGVVLAAMRAAGNSFLFLAIMFIGLGILLVIVVVVGWKCTPRGHEPLHALFGIGNFRNSRGSGQTRERRRRRHRNRDGNWYGGVLYPEFQYRRPPPSYAASMQDYQNQLQHGGGDAGRGPSHPSNGVENSSLPNSPPPSYRSRASTAHSGIHIAFPGSASTGNTGNSGTPDGDLPGSRPPTYRSRAPSRRPSLPRNDTRELNNDGGDVDFGDSQTFNALEFESNQPQGSSSEPVAGLSEAVSSTQSSHSITTSPVSSSTPHSPGSVTLQVYTLPTVRADNQNPFISASSSTQYQANPVSGARTSASPTTTSINSTALSISSSPLAIPSTMPPSSSHTSMAAPPVPPARLPSLHQRMESGDRRMLEDALQSLEQHMDNEEGAVGQDGIVNLGASFDPEELTEHYNTHL